MNIDEQVIQIICIVFQMFGRTLKLSIAKDNGRSTEFNSKRIYTEKERCYECGEAGHLSYKCPINVLGNRDLPSKTKNNKKKRPPGTADDMQAMATEFEENQCDDDVSVIIRNDGKLLIQRTQVTVFRSFVLCKNM